MRVTSFRVVAAVVLGVLLLGAPTRYVGAVPAQHVPLSGFRAFQQDAERQAVFESLVATVEAVAPLAGPLNNSLVEDPSVLSTYPANVSVDNFHASADFIVPAADSSGIPWDVGFIFGASGGRGVIVVVDSLGSWATSIGGGAPVERGVVQNLSTRPGDVNRLDLFVIQGTAMLGVNGQFVAQLVLPAMPGTGDVGVGAAFFSDQVAPGRGIDFANFTVRALVLPTGPGQPAAQQQPAAQAPASQRQPAVQAPTQGSSTTQSAAQGEAQTQGSVPGTGVIDEEVKATFALWMTQLESEPPSEGPISFEITEGDRLTRLAGPMTRDAANFVASMTLINPERTIPPWTVGFSFRADEQIYLTSTGHIIAAHPDGSSRVIGQAMNFDATPGAANTLQLVVVLETVMVGVNGVPAAQESLAGTDLEAGTGVALVAGLIPQDRITGRTIPYENYRVWYLVD